MIEITISVKKFQHLFDYIARIGLDAEEISEIAHIKYQRIMELGADQNLPAQQYSRLYKATVKKMESLGQPLPWAAGIGSESFELMCHCIINSKTLADSLSLAMRFDALLYPIQRYGMSLQILNDVAVLSYRSEVGDHDSTLIPQRWERAEHQRTVSMASGLLAWQGICGWLTGQPLQVDSVAVSGGYLNAAYSASLQQTFKCPVTFNQSQSSFCFAAEQLQRRVVQTADVLPEFFNNLVYQLIIAQKEPASTSTAVKSLVSIDLTEGMPSFASVADSLYTSESSLRRLLQKEGTSFRQLKDEVRCEIAIEKLLEDKMRIGDISDFLGFSEASSFVRSFRSWTGLTPKVYQQKMQQLGQG